MLRALHLLVFFSTAGVHDTSSSDVAPCSLLEPGTPPMHLGWSARLRIARGVASGLAYLHDKKCVHGNVRPSNILLDADMEPLLADLGIHRLVRGAGDSRLKPAGRFGSKRSAKSLPDLSPPPPGTAGGGASPLAGAGPSSSAEAAAHYQAPEAAKNPTKPSSVPPRGYEHEVFVEMPKRERG